MATEADPVAAVHPDDEPRRRLHVDLTPLRNSPDFRRIWVSGLITYFGSLATYVALPFQIKQLTGSLALAGLLGAAEVVPIVVFGLWGGALADAVDRRRLTIATEACLMVLTGLLLANTLLPHPQVWPIFVVSALFATVDSLQRPSLDALIAAVVPHEQMTAAAALSSARYSIGGIAGTTLAGVMLTTLGTWSAFTFDIATTALSLVFLFRVAHVHVAREGQEEVMSLRGVVDGLHYAWSRKDLLGTYTVDVLAMVFGMTVAIYPFLAVTLDAPWALGLLFAAESLGSLTVSLTSGWTTHVHHHGRAIAYAAATFGVAMTCVGLAPNIWVALAALTVAGGADMVSGIFRAAVWNQSIPDELRGRLAGIELLSYSVGPVAGNARAGIVASLTSVRTSIVSGGLVVVAATLVAGRTLSALWGYDDRTNEHVLAKKAARS